MFVLGEGNGVELMPAKKISMNSVGLFLNPASDGKMEILDTLPLLTDLNCSQVNYCSPAALILGVIWSWVRTYKQTPYVWSLEWYRCVLFHLHGQWLPFMIDREGLGGGRSIKTRGRKDSRKRKKRLQEWWRETNRRSKRGGNWTRQQQKYRRNRQVVLPCLDSGEEQTTCQSQCLFWSELHFEKSHFIFIRKHTVYPFYTAFSCPSSCAEF